MFGDRSRVGLTVTATCRRQYPPETALCHRVKLPSSDVTSAISRFVKVPFTPAGAGAPGNRESTKGVAIRDTGNGRQGVRLTNA